MIKALGQDTGIYINHFVVMNSDGFKGMVAALLSDGHNLDGITSKSHLAL